MPELPEVETIAASLYPHVRDCAFTFARVLRPSSLHPLSLAPASLEGARISGVGRRGKLLIFNLEGAKPQMLVAHLRMTGRIFTASANSELGMKKKHSVPTLQFTVQSEWSVASLSKCCPFRENHFPLKVP